MRSRYRCAHCKKVVKRDSRKAWLKSYCVTTGCNVRLVLMKGK